MNNRSFDSKYTAAEERDKPHGESSHGNVRRRSRYFPITVLALFFILFVVGFIAGFSITDADRHGGAPDTGRQDNASPSDVSDYILPYSDSQYLTYADLEGLSKEEVMLARNEIYARHGRQFYNDTAREYFASQTWYEPTCSPENFSNSVFNTYEQENLNTIISYERSKGWG